MPALMNTDARRAASAAYHAKRTESGLRKVTLWLSPEARFKLDALKAAAGSKDKAAEAAIMAWNGPMAPNLDDVLSGSGAVRMKPADPAPPSKAKPTAKPKASARPVTRKTNITQAQAYAAVKAARAEPPVHVAAPVFERKKFNPQPKKGKAK